jgi:hypothetical protein
MAITYTEIDSARASAQGRDWKRTYTRAFLATTDNPLLGAGTVRAGLTDSYGHKINLGTAYRVYDALGNVIEQDLGCFAGPISAASDPQAGDGCGWIVTVEYSAYDAAEFPLNPIDHPLKISWDSNRTQVPAEEDVNGDAIVNSAGDYFFDPPVMVDDSRWVLTIVRNEPTFDPDWADTYKDAINTDPFFGRDPKTWKVASITSGDPIHDTDSGTKDGWYYAVKYQFEHDPDGWDLKILDKGMRKLDQSTLKTIEVRDEKGEKISEPVLLDGSGNVLAKDADPYFVIFDYYKEVAFADLQLDPSGAPGQGN